MANRDSKFLLKRSNVSGKIPTEAQLDLGELGLNIADAKLYTEYTGGFSASTEVRQIGWDRLSTESGGTVNGDVIINGDLTVTGVTNLNNISTIITVGEDVINGDLLYLGSNGTYLKTSNTLESTSSTELRIITENVTSGSTGSALIQGQYTTTGLTSGDKYWLGVVSGSYTNTQPNGNGDIVRYIGTALNSTTLEFMPDETWIEISSSSGPSTNPNYRAVTTSTNILTTDFTVNVTTTGDTTQTLPNASGITGKIINIKNSDSSGTSTITINTTGGQLIDGQYDNTTTITLQYPRSLTFQSNGSGWIII